LGGHLGAVPGVLMRADPKTGTSSYLQGLAPVVQFIDKARCSRPARPPASPPAATAVVLVVDEWNPQAQPQDGHQFKYHAPGVGVVQIRREGRHRAGDPGATKIHTLTDHEIERRERPNAAARPRAYGTVPDVYRHTAFAAVRK